MSRVAWQAACRWAALVTAAIALGPIFGPGAMGQRLSVGGGLSAATGSFIFTEPTTSWVLTTSVQVDGNRWRLGVSLPVIMQNSTAVTMIGGIPLPTGGPNAGPIGDRSDGEKIPMQKRRPSDSGGGSGPGALWAGPAATLVDSGAVEGLGPYATHVGDPLVDIGGDLFVSRGGSVRLGAQLFAKVPLASVESGVGTGAFDYGAGATLSVMAGGTIAFADVSHWVLGDLPDLRLADMTTGAVGLGRAVGASRRLSVLATASGATAFTDTVDPALAAGVAVGYALRPDRFLTAGATFGLSETVADWTVSVGWRLGLERPGRWR